MGGDRLDDAGGTLNIPGTLAGVAQVVVLCGSVKDELSERNLLSLHMFLESVRAFLHSQVAWVSAFRHCGHIGTRVDNWHVGEHLEGGLDPGLVPVETEHDPAVVTNHSAA